MANGNYFVFTAPWGTEYGIKPDGIGFSDSESIDVSLNRGGNITKVPVKKKEVTLTIEGILDGDVAQFQNYRINTATGLANSSFTPPDLEFPGYIIPEAALVDIQPSGLFIAFGLNTWNKLEAKFQSQQFI